MAKKYKISLLTLINFQTTLIWEHSKIVLMHETISIIRYDFYDEYFLFFCSIFLIISKKFFVL